MERIGAMTAGVLSVNPNTMYPLLRQLEGRGLIEGQWEHPERRSRRYYSLTDEGRSEYARLVEECRLADEIIAGASFDDTFVHNGEVFSLRLVHVHMIGEYARHIGHADMVRERLDGVTGD